MWLHFYEFFINDEYSTLDPHRDRMHKITYYTLLLTIYIYVQFHHLLHTKISSHKIRSVRSLRFWFMCAVHRKNIKAQWAAGLSHSDTICKENPTQQYNTWQQSAALLRLRFMWHIINIVRVYSLSNDMYYACRHKLCLFFLLWTMSTRHVLIRYL